MALSREDVAGIARYARIALDDGELDEMCAYLNEAIGLLDPILVYDLDGVEPTFHPIGGLANVTRADVAVPGLGIDETLANATSVRGRSFRVPAILGSRDAEGQPVPGAIDRPATSETPATREMGGA